MVTKANVWISKCVAICLKLQKQQYGKEGLVHKLCHYNFPALPVSTKRLHTHDLKLKKEREREKNAPHFASPQVSLQVTGLDVVCISM
jgi:hypothetical protein